MIAAAHLHALEVPLALVRAIPEHKLQLALCPELPQPVVLPEAPQVGALQS